MRLEAELSESFWWIPLFGRRQSIIAWVGCTVIADVAATVEVTFRTGGTCCPD